MIDRDISSQVDKSIKNLHIIWFFLLGSLAIYLFIGLYLKETLNPQIRSTLPSDTLRWALYLISAATFIMIYFLKKIIIKAAARAESRAGRSKDQHPVIARYTTAVVISLAVAESIGIYGLILYFLIGQTEDLISLMVLSAVAMILHRPKREELSRLIDKEEKKTGP
ncbi:MAG: hypothetical protein JRJ48_08080 [Deltaproteobacteria bacterium]|nr:hypothetical protein [Deltaproteobacteria bacterium]